MADTWYDEHGDLPPPQIDLMGWLRAVARGIPLLIVVSSGLLLMLLLRLIERPLCGLRRPVTPYITQFVCRAFFFILGMRHCAIGQPMRGAGAVVANHSSWLDIFALNMRKRIYFVSKSEVAAWPGIGLLAKVTGTVFIERRRRDAAAQVSLFRDRLAAGQKLLFFPEGTSTDGRRVLPFKPTLFAAFFDQALIDHMQVQPVSVVYDAPLGRDPRFYGWWGGMAFGENLMTMLSIKEHGAVTVIYHDPVRVADYADRKALAKVTEVAVRSGLTDHQAMKISQG